jgi:hypothetical protein
MCPEDDLELYLSISIFLGDSKCTSTHQVREIRQNLIGGVDMALLNNFSSKTNQKKLLVRSIQDDYYSIEQAKSLLDFHPFRKTNPRVPAHLYFINSPFYQVGLSPFFCISVNDLRLLKLGYVIFDNSDELHNALNSN